ncbi:MAG TPA: LacI family DNA-binding transcriptional regulator [Ktedonobacterales bacterium]|nr:LacI family DNA-binding transcriptional regulator [Ktedonobacterales bacterium]
MATISDVARRAGVTTATVSNVITGKVVVSEKTRARVLEAIKDLGYRPNLVARGLARGKTFTIALVVPTISNPFFSEVVEEVEQIADRHDFQLMLSTTYNSMEQGRRHLERMSSRWVDGFIVMGMSADIADVLAVAQRGKPVVLSVWNQDPRAQTLPIVDIDFRYAGELATQHLLQLGHRRIATILEEPVQHSRLEGYKLLLAAQDIPFVPGYMVQGDSSFESGSQAARTLFALPEPPTAIFAGNDMMSLGAIEALTDMGYDVPGDVSVVGVDDIALARHARPPLTTIGIPKREMARAATELLMRRINSHGVHDKAITTLIRPQLVVRQSTAEPAGGKNGR